MRRLLPLATLVLVVAACGTSAAHVPRSAIALVGGHPVSRADFRAELARARRSYSARSQAFPRPGTPAYARLRESVVQLLVNRVQLELEAKEARIAISPAQVDARLRRLKQVTFGGDEQRYREQLRQTGMTEADIRQAIRVELLADALRGTKATPPEIVYAPGFEPSGGA